MVDTAKSTRKSQNKRGGKKQVGSIKVIDVSASLIIYIGVEIQENSTEFQSQSMAVL